MIEDYISRQQAIDKMQELEEEDDEMYGCSIPEGFDGKRAIEALKTLPGIRQPEFIIKSDGSIEQIKDCNNCVFSQKTSHRDNIHFPDFNNCKWIFDFNAEVSKTITINTEVLARLVDRIDILERKLAEYEKIL